MLTLLTHVELQSHLSHLSRRPMVYDLGVKRGVFARYSTSINGCEPPAPPLTAAPGLLGTGPGPGLWVRLAGLGERLGWYKGEELGELGAVGAGATAGCGLLGAGAWQAMRAM